MKGKTSWFTFGQGHVHRVNGRTFDADTVVEITAPNPRQLMFNLFGRQWGSEYPSLEEVRMEFYRRLVRLNDAGGFDEVNR